MYPSFTVQYHYGLLPEHFKSPLGTVRAKNGVRNAPASSALIQVLHQIHNMRTANHHLHGKGERNGTQRRTKVNFVNFVRTMMQAVELLWLVQRHTSRRSDIEQCRNRACSYI